MSDDDWDKEDIETPVVVLPVVKKGQWDDEDKEDEDVKDSWDASDDDEKEQKKPVSAGAAAPKAPVKKKATLAQKIAERNALEQKKKEEKAARNVMDVEEEDDPFKNETPEQRKARLESNIRAADLQRAKDLFGVTDTEDMTAQQSFLDTMIPKTKPEFDKFASLLTEKLSIHEKSTHFGSFVESLTRDLCVSLSVDDIKRISTALNVLANEKQKASKPVAGKKKAPAKKAVLKTGPAGDNDTTNYDDVYDDFDDFM